MKLTTLDYIVNNVMLAREENSLHKYQRYLQFAIRGFRELSLFGTTQVKVAYLDMENNKAINLPSDYVKYTKVGVCVNGRVILLGLDDSLCINDTYDACGNPLEIAMSSTSNEEVIARFGGTQYLYMPHFRNGQYVEGVYGLGGGQRGYFRENLDVGQIQFSSDVIDTEVVLEYISDGVNPDGTASVPMEAVEPLIAWVNWKIIENDPHRLGELAYAERRYITEFRKFKHFKQSFSMSEFLSALRSNYMQSPKF